MRQTCFECGLFTDVTPIADEPSSSDDDYALPPDATDFSNELDVKCLIQDGGSYDLSTSVCYILLDR